MNRNRVVPLRRLAASRLVLMGLMNDGVGLGLVELNEIKAAMEHGEWCLEDRGQIPGICLLARISPTLEQHEVQELRLANRLDTERQEHVGFVVCGEIKDGPVRHRPPEVDPAAIREDRFLSQL